MAGDHKCPVCGSTFTRSQHVARHMRSHTGDRPYKCSHCGDQFARSDLLSRHVNKCHSADRLKAGLSGRRKGRQPSSSSARPQTQEAVYQQPNLSHPNLVANTSDPYLQHPPTSTSTRPPYAPSSLYDPRQSYDPSQSSSYPPSASASVDNLHPAPSYQTQSATVPRQADPFYRPSYPSSYQQPPHPMQRADSFALFKDPTGPNAQPSTDASTFHDLPTPMGFPSTKHRTLSHSSYGTSEGSLSNLYPSSSRYGSDTQSTHHLDSSHQPYLANPPEPPLGEGGFSSAFGLMSLEDPNVIAGVSEPVPFFDTNATPHHQQDLHAYLQHPAHSANPVPPHVDGVDWYSFIDPQNLSPEARDKEAKALQQIWSAFLRDPTTGLRPDGTEKQKPSFPTPTLHRRSSSYSGRASNSNPPPPQPGSAHPTRAAPSDRAYAAPSDPAQSRNYAVQRQRSQQNMQPPHAGTLHNPEQLRGYEEAVLARKAPVLKLPTKLRTRDSGPTSATSTGSSVLPTLSGIREYTGGGVGSLAQTQQMPASAAAASAVPPGSTMNQGLAALQNSRPQERIVHPMPKPRSRPSTATGHYQENSPPGQSSGRATPSTRSDPPSRPGTASGFDLSGVAPAGESRPSTSQGSPSNPNNTSYPVSHLPPSTGMFAHGAVESRSSTAQSSPQQQYAIAQQLQTSSTQFPSYVQFGTMAPPNQFPNSSYTPQYQYQPNTHQFAYNTTNYDDPSAAMSRPSYKRLASQILEPAVNKRPHIHRGGEADDENPVEDDEEEDLTPEHAASRYGRMASGPNSALPSRSTSGSSGVDVASVSNPSSYGHDSVLAASYRRMSEPSSQATRMYPRPHPVVVGGGGGGGVVDLHGHAVRGIPNQ